MLFEKDEVLLLITRSSMSFKYNIRLCNQVRLINADYNNKNNEELWNMWKYLAQIFFFINAFTRFTSNFHFIISHFFI